MLQPKRTKFRKQHKGRIHGDAKGGSDLTFGGFGLKATEPERVTARQIEAARRALTRHMKRQGRVWIRVFPDVPVTKKPIEIMSAERDSIVYPGGIAQTQYRETALEIALIATHVVEISKPRGSQAHVLPRDRVLAYDTDGFPGEKNFLNHP